MSPVVPPPIPTDPGDQIQLILDALKTVVDEAGHDYIYHSPARYDCRYIHPDTGKPDCIAARVLHRLGMPLDQLARNETKTCYFPMMWDSVNPGTYSEDAAYVLRNAQVSSDFGHLWGNCLKRTLVVANLRSQYLNPQRTFAFTETAESGL